MTSMPLSLHPADTKSLGHAQDEGSKQWAELDTILVDFATNDVDDPLNWALWRKWLIVFAMSLMGFVSVFSTMTIVPAAPQALQELGSNDSTYRTLLVTIWELGEGVGPFFIAPLSERFGRLPVFHIGNFLALLSIIASALSVNVSMLIAFRFLSGCFLPILTLGPAIVGDMFPDDQLGVAMTLALGCQQIAEFISPLTGSFIAASLGWRWSIWLPAIVLGAFSLLLFTVLRETYAVKILERRATVLNKSQGSIEYVSKHKFDDKSENTIDSVTKPIRILARSPITMLISLYTAVAYALANLLFATITEVMESSYHISDRSVGLTFLGLAIGNVVAMLSYALTSDRWIKYRKKTKQDDYRPESRLVHLLFAAASLPVGLVLYGWTLAYRVQYVVPILGSGIVGFSMLLSILPTETYLVDVYGIHSASAIAAGVILRAVLGAVLPLIGPPLYQAIGLGWGNSVLALIAAVFIPPLVMLMRFGNWFRKKDRFLGPQT